MRLLDRYLLRELLMPFAYCLGGFLIFWISSDLFDKLGEFQEARMRVWDVARYYLVKSPQLLAIVLPVALLLALLYALTQHARHHEITAMRAAGVGLWRLATPYLVVGFLASLGLFYLNETWAADADDRADLIKAQRAQPGQTKFNKQIVQNLGFVNTRDGRNWTIKSLNTETMVMTSPVIFSTRAGAPVWFYASQAVHSNGVWVFFNAREYRSDPSTNSAPVPTIQEPVLARPDLTETPAEIRSEVAVGGQQTSIKRRHRAEVSLAEIRNYLTLHPNPPPGMQSMLYTKLHSRIAGPWKCLVVVLIALPFGAAAGRRNVFAGVAGSIVICFAYFALLEISLAAGTAGFMPPWLAGWLPNIVFTLTGVWLTTRVR